METLFKALQEPMVQNFILDVPPIPANARNWLGRLSLLHGVPFQYLVPDERMLPPESLRFFYVDPLWMEALLDGALSIGRPDETRTLLNKAMAGTYVSNEIKKELEKAPAGSSADQLIDEARKIRPQRRDPVPPPAIEGSFDFSGFLLRSDLVVGWRGVGVTAKAKRKQKIGGQEDSYPLLTLRLERLAPDVLFGLFEGTLDSLDIIQPVEGLHFEKRATSVDKNRVVKLKEYLGSKPNESAQLATKLLAQPIIYTFTIDGAAR